MQIFSQDKKHEIEFQNVCFAYGENEILKNVSFSVTTGETYVIIGQCGFGKSTILKLCCGLLKPEQGNIFINGRDISRMLQDELMEVRLNLGYVFQNSALISNMPLYSNIALPLQYHTDYTDEKIDKIVKSRIKLLNLKGFENALPHSLSMGVMKRAAVARALALMPGIMLYDEPTSALDPINASLLNEVIQTLHSGFGITSIIVTHDMKSALNLGTSIALVADKKIAFTGNPEEFKKTDNKYVKDFLEKS